LEDVLVRPERDQIRGMAMNLLGLGLEAVEHHEDALSVKESELATMRRRDADEGSILIVQSNLASTYQKLRRFEEARMASTSRVLTRTTCRMAEM